MCQQLSELREAIGRFAKCFDARSLLGSDAARVLDDAAAIERIVRAIKALAVARVEETAAWGNSDHRSSAEALSRRTGISKGEAKDILESGKRLAEQPDVADAALGGKLSPSQASLIAGAVEADPAAAAHLIQKAQDGSLTELRDEVARTKAAVTDLEERRRSIHRHRRLQSSIDTEGAWHLNGYGNPEDGAQIMAALGPIQDEIFRQARKEDRRESPDAYAFDSLVQLAVEATSERDYHVTAGIPGAVTGLTTDPGSESADKSDSLFSQSSDADPHEGSTSADAEGATKTHPADRRRRRRGAPVKLLLRVDYNAWLRGVAAPGETCELAGYGPIPMSVAQELIATGDPFVAAILTKGEQLVGVAHLGRKPTAHQESALEWLYPTCAARGCSDRGRLERDHEIDWSKTHFTMLDHLDLLCHHHHYQKTTHNWALVPGTGKRDFVPPDDSRHPRFHPDYQRQPSNVPPARPTRSRPATPAKPAPVPPTSDRRQPAPASPTINRRQPAPASPTSDRAQPGASRQTGLFPTRS
jgi:Domain of unknown function (DUF222)